jgi:hypothetical protein
VNPNNSVVHLLGWSSNITTFNQATDYPLLFTDGNLVYGQLAQSGGAGINAYFVVIEFQGSALNQNVQNFTIQIPAATTPGTATINTVNPNNTVIFGAGYNADNGTTTATNTFFTNIQLGSATQVWAETNTLLGVGHFVNAYGSVVEFASGVLNSAVQRGIISFSGNTSATASLTPVTAANTAMNWLYNTTMAASVNLRTSLATGVLTNGTTVTEKITTAGTVAGSWEIAEFPAYVPPPYNDALWFGMNF